MDALNLDLPDVRWALGQAVSRAYGNNPMLIPAIDCVNHSGATAPPITCVHDGAACPACHALPACLSAVEASAGSSMVSLCVRRLRRIKNEEGQSLTCVSNFAPDFCTRELCAGEEVVVNYAGADGFERGAMEMFVDYGFMPPELLERNSSVAGDDEDFDL